MQTHPKLKRNFLWHEFGQVKINEIKNREGQKVMKSKQWWNRIKLQIYLIHKYTPAHLNFDILKMSKSMLNHLRIVVFLSVSRHTKQFSKTGENYSFMQPPKTIQRFNRLLIPRRIYSFLRCDFAEIHCRGLKLNT